MGAEITTDTIARAQAGDLTSLGLLYTRHHLSVFRYLVGRVGDQQVAEDLAAEVFLRMLRSLSSYRPQGVPFQAWLFQIARHLAADHFRQQRGRRLVQLDEALASGEPDPAAVNERELTHRRLHAALAKLNPDQQEVIILRFMVGMSLAETAYVLQRSEDAIKGLQRRGLSALRAQLVDLEMPYV
jgi:RNA polymerase sigma-70 factor (ECF subfamily)